MNKERYERTVRYFKSNPKANFWLKIIYKFLPLLMFAAYPMLLVYSFLYLEQKFLGLFFVPLFVLIIVSISRYLIDEPRPYERYGIPSVFEKQTKGKSMPSRHTSSAFIIAMAFLSVNVPLGAVMMTFAVLIELSRILAGAHYIRDVIAGMSFSLFVGMIMFLL